MEVPGDAPKKFFLAGLYPGEWVLENAEGEKAFSVKEEGKCAYLLLSPGINALTFITKNMLPSDGNETNGIVKSGN